LCQYRLGRLLYDAMDRKERDYLQAIALFQLAAENGSSEARQLASSESPKLTDEQTAWVGSLKRQIVRK
jgi:TPR repeat protein